MQIGTRSVCSQFQKRDALEAQADDRTFFCISITFVPYATVGLQQVRMLGRKAIETLTAQTVLTFDDKAQTNRKFAEGLLISLDCGQARQQIPFAVGRTARVELTVNYGSGEWTDGPIGQMAHRLNVVVTINQESVRTRAALTVDDRIAVAHPEAARADAHALHHLFDRFRHCAHARTARGYRWHATDYLQALSEALRITVNVTIVAGETH